MLKNTPKSTLRLRNLFLSIFMLGFVVPGNSQCAMCRAVLESNGDQSVAEGINNGIVYLMAVPYLLVGVLIFIVYRKIKSN